MSKTSTTLGKRAVVIKLDHSSWTTVKMGAAGVLSEKLVASYRAPKPHICEKCLFRSYKKVSYSQLCLHLFIWRF
jgi:hypothetical protein